MSETRVEIQSIYIIASCDKFLTIRDWYETLEWTCTKLQNFIYVWALYI